MKESEGGGRGGSLRCLLVPTFDLSPLCGRGGARGGGFLPGLCRGWTPVLRSFVGQRSPQVSRTHHNPNPLGLADAEKKRLLSKGGLMLA